MPLKHMILGCLLDAPSHGYEIKQQFNSFYQRSHGVNEGQLYVTLKKLEEDGLIRKDTVYQEKNPPRKMISITDKGKLEFSSWLMEETEPNDLASFDFFRVFPFLEKCTYFKNISSDEARGLIERQIEAENLKLEEFKRVKNQMQEKKVDRTRINIIEFGITFQETKIRWLKSING